MKRSWHLSGSLGRLLCVGLDVSESVDIPGKALQGGARSSTCGELWYHGSKARGCVAGKHRLLRPEH